MTGNAGLPPGGKVATTLLEGLSHSVADAPAAMATPAAIATRHGHRGELAAGDDAVGEEEVEAVARDIRSGALFR